MKDNLFVLTRGELTESEELILGVLSDNKCLIARNIEAAFEAGLNQFWGAIIDLETLKDMAWQERCRVSDLLLEIRGVLLWPEEMNDLHELSIWGSRTLNHIRKQEK